MALGQTMKWLLILAVMVVVAGHGVLSLHLKERRMSQKMLDAAPNSNWLELDESVLDDNQACTSNGTLFIIGGGYRPMSMMEELVSRSGVRSAGDVVVLTFATPDNKWGKITCGQFAKLGVAKKHIHMMHHATQLTEDQTNTIKNAKLIYMVGGSQGRFMKKVLHTSIQTGIVWAYHHGATIAGTSAGASVMSRVMMMPHGRAEVKSIRTKPGAEDKEGLGLLRGVILDQHFVTRQRLNRLVIRSLEHPSKICIGIDESTALVLHGQQATVVGKSQVVVLRGPKNVHKSATGRLGGTGLKLDVYIPGDQFKLLSCASNRPLRPRTIPTHNIKNSKPVNNKAKVAPNTPPPTTSTVQTITPGQQTARPNKAAPSTPPKTAAPKPVPVSTPATKATATQPVQQAKKPAPVLTPAPAPAAKTPATKPARNPTPGPTPASAPSSKPPSSEKKPSASVPSPKPIATPAVKSSQTTVTSTKQIVQPHEWVSPVYD